MKYKTKQKEYILKLLRDTKQEFSIKDLYNKCNKEVGLTTIYRLVNKLVQENRITKHICKDNVTYYCYLKECECDNHFYLKCINCGDVIHIDCDCINELYDHVYNKHKFKLNKNCIFIDGLCHKCCKGAK